jgi:hypothetical protein
MSRGSNPSKVAEWSDRIDRFENSGQSVVQFCIAEGVSQPSFYQWKKRLGVVNRVRGGQPKQRRKSSRAKNPARGAGSKSAFTSVQLTPTPGLPQSTKIRLANGVEIELGNNLRVVELVIRSVVEQVLPGTASRTGGTPC